MLDVKGDYNPVVTIYSILKKSFVCTENSGVGEVRGEVRGEIRYLPINVAQQTADVSYFFECGYSSRAPLSDVFSGLLISFVNGS